MKGGQITGAYPAWTGWKVNYITCNGNILSKQITLASIKDGDVCDAAVL